MPMLPRVLWLLFALLPAARALALGDVLFERVGDAETIPDNNVTALAQDREGFLWIGTPNGLIRYDGYRYTRQVRNARDPHALGGVFIRALLVARDGRLWIGTDADGVSVHDAGSGRFATHRHDPGNPRSLAHDQVRALAQDREGTVWLGTRAGLERYDAASGGFEHIAGAPGDGDPRVYALLADAEGRLWIGGWNGVRVRHADGRVDSVPGLAGQLILSLYGLSDGRVAVGTAEAGNYLVDPHSFASQAIPAGLDEPASANEALALAMIEARPGELWLGGFGGIAVVSLADGHLLRRMQPDPAVDTSLAHNQVRCFLLDRAGQLWIGGYSGGLQRHDPGNDAIRLLHHSPGRPGSLSRPSIGSILQLADGRVWLGTRQDGIDVLDLERGVVGGFRAAPGQPGALWNGVVISLAAGADERVYAGTLAGLFRFDPASARFEAIGRAQGLNGSTVRALLAEPTGEVWIGSNTGLGRWSPARGRAHDVPLVSGATLAADVSALAREPQGRLWVGSAGGLYRVEAGEEVLRSHGATAADGIDLARESIVGLLWDAGTLWVDSSEGLVRLRGDPATGMTRDAVSARHGIGGEPFGANLLRDAQGRIWTHKRIYDPASDRVHELSRADGIDIGTPWFRSYAQLQDGRMLFGGSKGVAIIDPQRYRAWQHQPPLVISQLQVDGVALPAQAWRDGLRVAAGSRAFAVEFAALDYTAPQRLRYAHRLEGFDADWVESDAARRVASYSNLWPGEYRLLVRASNRAGQWSPQPLVLAVTVLPRYWQTPWFALLVCTLLGAAVYLLWRRQLARVHRHEQELEQMVGERTQQLSDAKEHAESALAQLRGTQQQLVAAEKMAALGQLVAGVAHEINTPLGVALTAASVQAEELRTLRQRVGARELRPNDLQHYLEAAGQASQLVEGHLQRAARLVQSFRQVSPDRSRDERARFELGPWLRELGDEFVVLREAGRIRVQVECAPGLVLDSYPVTLAQVLRTFAQNALQHAFDADAAGTLTLRAQAAGEDAVEIEFADDGRGMPETELRRVFEPFHTTRRAEGYVGLGLHIVFDRVHARLGGRVEVASEPGRGTRFKLRLPRVAP